MIAINLALYIVSFGLLTLLWTVCGSYGIVRSFVGPKPRLGVKGISEKQLKIATLIDMLGNVLCAELFNDILITAGATYFFGRLGETISEVLGYNMNSGTLTNLGFGLVMVLDFFDPGHCQKCIKSPVTYTLTKKQRIIGHVIVGVILVGIGLIIFL